MLPVSSPGSLTEAPASSVRPPEKRALGPDSARGPVASGGGVLRVAQGNADWPPRSPSRPSRSDPVFASPSRGGAGTQSVAAPTVRQDTKPGATYVEIETDPAPQGAEAAPLLPGVELRSNLPRVWLYPSGSRSSSRSRGGTGTYGGTSPTDAPRSSKLERNVASYWVLGLTIVCLMSASALVMTLMNRGFLGSGSGARRSTGSTSAGPRVLQTDEPLPGDPNFKVGILFRPTDNRSQQIPLGPFTARTPPFFTPPARPAFTPTRHVPIGSGEGETPPLPEPAPPAGGWLDYDPFERDYPSMTNESAANVTSDDGGGIATEATSTGGGPVLEAQLLMAEGRRPNYTDGTGGDSRATVVGALVTGAVADSDWTTTHAEAATTWNDESAAFMRQDHE